MHRNAAGGILGMKQEGRADAKGVGLKCSIRQLLMLRTHTIGTA